jgi:hypothetical protein
MSSARIDDKPNRKKSVGIISDNVFLFFIVTMQEIQLPPIDLINFENIDKKSFVEFLKFLRWYRDHLKERVMSVWVSSLDDADKYAMHDFFWRQLTAIKEISNLIATLELWEQVVERNETKIPMVSS